LQMDVLVSNKYVQHLLLWAPTNIFIAKQMAAPCLLKLVWLGSVFQLLTLLSRSCAFLRHT